MYQLFSRRMAPAYLSLALFCTLTAQSLAQSNVTVRIMAANLNGNTQSILPFEVNIYKGLKPDVVCIQEFNYNNNTAADFRALIDDAFGTNFSYYRESGGLQIPNGIVSRYPIISSGRWTDTQVSNRGFAWARIDLPGSNDLYAVSVHLKSGSSDSGTRATEANNLKTLIAANFPTNAWIVIGGDFNAYSRTETAITTLASLCPDSPQPTDAESGGNFNSNANRNNPYDYVLASRSMTNYLTNVVFASHSFSKGLVFDSRVYTPLSDVSPIVLGDSGQGQHMAILKDFSIPAGGSNAPVAPVINTQPQNQTVAVGATANFNVAASGTAPLAYQWRFNGTNISGAQTNLYSLPNAQTTNNGSYTIVITNSVGSITSSIATLTVSNVAPTITTNPAALAVFTGETAAFSVTAAGTAPLAYQWRFNGTNINAATNEDYTFNNVQTNHAGNYTVIVTNSVGSVTSAIAVLTVSNAAPVILTNPASITVTVGGTANFTVTADGATPLEFQWRFNGVDIAGETTTSYSLTNAQTTNAGNYTIVVTNNAGSITSAVAVLTVNAAVAGTATNVVISQIYGGGGRTGAACKNDFVELFNPTAVAVNISGWSIQYAGATGTSWTVGNLSGTIQSYRYYLIQMTSEGAVGVTIPIAESTNSINCSATAGKFALVSNQTALTGANPVGNAAIVDLVGYGGTANGFEGSAPAVGGSSGNTSSVIRKSGGLTDSNSNTNDFTTAAPPTPRNSASPANPPSNPLAAAAPDISALVYSGSQFQFTVTGTATSNYIVQSCADLSLTNWISFSTNASPFTYTNLAANTFTQRFYRVKLK